MHARMLACTHAERAPNKKGEGDWIDTRAHVPLFFYCVVVFGLCVFVLVAVGGSGPGDFVGCQSIDQSISWDSI